MQQRDRHFKLFLTLLISILGFLAALVLLFFLMRLVFGILSYMPWLTYVYSLGVLSAPAAVFIPAWIIYLRRTSDHPVQWVMVLSYIIMPSMLLLWGIFYIYDLITFFRTGSTVIMKYMSWEMVFLAANVAVIFLMGVVQALSMPVEKDWMTKARERSA